MKKPKRVVLDIGYLLSGMCAFACVSDPQETSVWKFHGGKPKKVRLVAEVLD